MNAGMQMARPIALVVNTHHTVRRALCERISRSFGQLQLREAGSLEEALCILVAEYVEVVLVDTDLNGVNGLTSTRAVLECSPRSSVIVMAGFSEPVCSNAANRAGAMAFINRRAINSELIEVLAGVVGQSPAAGSVSRQNIRPDEVLTTR